jgi:hypothetical protein
MHARSWLYDGIQNGTMLPDRMNADIANPSTSSSTAANPYPESKIVKCHGYIVTTPRQLQSFLLMTPFDTPCIDQLVAFVGITSTTG